MLELTKSTTLGEVMDSLNKLTNKELLDMVRDYVPYISMLFDERLRADGLYPDKFPKEKFLACKDFIESWYGDYMNDVDPCAYGEQGMQISDLVTSWAFNYATYNDMAEPEYK